MKRGAVMFLVFLFLISFSVLPLGFGIDIQLSNIAGGNDGSFIADSNGNGYIDKADALSFSGPFESAGGQFHLLSDVYHNSAQIDSDGNGWPDVCDSLSEPASPEPTGGYYELIHDLADINGNSIDSDENGWPDMCDCVLSELDTDENNCGVCGNICDAGRECISGTCCHPDLGDSCGSCGGVVQCDGSCSVSTPANYGQSCGGSACVNSGTYDCSGNCVGETNKAEGVSCGDNMECDGSGECVTSLECCYNRQTYPTCFVEYISEYTVTYSGGSYTYPDRTGFYWTTSGSVAGEADEIITHMDEYRYVKGDYVENYYDAYRDNYRQYYEICREERTDCVSDYRKACYDGDVYWYDDCGRREELVDDCTGAEVCRYDSGDYVCKVPTWHCSTYCGGPYCIGMSSENLVCPGATCTPGTYGKSALTGVSGSGSGTYWLNACPSNKGTVWFSCNGCTSYGPCAKCMASCSCY